MDKPLAHSIRVRYGLAPTEPTPKQLAAVLAEMERLTKHLGRTPSLDELEKTVADHCPSYGTWKYAADVNVELRRQIALLAAQLKK